MNGKVACACLACGLGLSPAASGEWQISGEQRIAVVRTANLANTRHVQPWAVDTVTGATEKVMQDTEIVEVNLTAAYLQDASSRLIGLRYIGNRATPAPYDHLRLSNLIVAWHGEAGAIEGGYILTPVSWGRGLLVDRLRFSGTRARLQWNETNRTEIFWTDTLEQPERFSYSEISLAGARHEAGFSGGTAGFAVIDTRRQGEDFFPKRNCSHGVFTGWDAMVYPAAGLRVSAEGAYGRLEAPPAGYAGAGTAGLDWAALPTASLHFSAWYLGARFNPAPGFYSLQGEEESAGRIRLSWRPLAGSLDVKPGWGCKQKAGEKFWMPSFELQWNWEPAGIDFRFYEYAEQPIGRWGAEDHWEHTQASLSWQFWTYLFLTGRWEKIYDGFRHQKYIQLSAEVSARY